jgi:hypothetical protein
MKTSKKDAIRGKVDEVTTAGVYKKALFYRGYYGNLGYASSRAPILIY